MEYRIEKQSRGTRILFGDEVKERQTLLNKMISIVETYGFEGIILPSVEPQELYIDKAGSEVLNQMYVFDDKKGRKLCLRPEATATVQQIAKHFCQENDFDKLIYFIENTNELDKRVIDFSDDCLYITSDGVLGIRFKRLEVRHTYDVDKKKAYREKYFMVNISDKNEYYHSSSIYHDAPKESLSDYNLIDGVFVKKN